MECYPYEMTAGQKAYLPVKYMLDKLIALAGLILLVVPFFVIALIQKIREPKEYVFFVQERVGQYGKTIRIVKFRTMKSTFDPYLDTNHAAAHKGEMTKFGKFLRNSSIDELPQLLQVLTGEMSLVGPRPLIPQEKDVHRMRMTAGVYQLRPGITGWAQINGRDYVSNEEKAFLDRVYLERFSFGTDIKILLKTVKQVFKQTDIL